MSTTKKTPEVILARHAGFCPGVRRATELLEQALQKARPGERVCTLGHLIHNELYNSRMAERGVITVENEELPAFLRTITPASPVTLLTRAHGMTEEVAGQLCAGAETNPALSCLDCTCPFVAKIHKIVAENDGADRVLLLMGTPGHPEAEGILSRFHGEKYVLASSEALGELIERNSMWENCAKVPILVAQTTFSLVEWGKSQEILKNLCTNPIIFDTICSVTEARQNEACALAAECDGMIVIGGRASSNTAKLRQICEDHCPDTLLVSDSTEVPPEFRTTHRRVGIVAGASTPGDIIEEVVKTMDQVENFGEMLEAQCATLNTGDVVTGTVEYVTDAELQLDLGAGVTGYIKAEQISDDPSVKLTEQFKRGDQVEAFVIRVSDIEGVAELSKKRADADREFKKLADAVETGEVLEGKVLQAVKGGVIVSVSANQVFVPASQTGVPKEGDLNELVGKTVRLKAIEMKDRKRVVGSISRVLREERRANESAFWDNIEEGKVYTGPVKSMTSYGAFIDLGGVDGMVHMSELSWKRIKSPAEVLSVGQEVTVFVKSFDKEKRRISLGYKTEESNPWNVFTSKYAVGDVASVKIVNMMPFGAFAEIVDGVDGLIHISQIANQRIAKPADALEIGQIVDAKIIDIDNEKQKVSLSIRALLEEAKADEAAPAEENAEA